MLKDGTTKMNTSSSEAEEERDEHPKADGDRDPDFSQVRPSPPYSCTQRDAAPHTAHTQY